MRTTFRARLRLGRVRGNGLRDGRLRSISILHVCTDQRDSSPSPNSNPISHRLGGLRSAGEVGRAAPKRILVAFFQKQPAERPKGQPRPIRQAPVTKFVAYPSCTWGESAFIYGATKPTPTRGRGREGRGTRKPQREKKTRRKKKHAGGVPKSYWYLVSMYE